MEEKLKITGDKKIICVNSGTSALHAILLLLKRKNRRNFLTPAFTFPSVMCNKSVSIEIADIDPRTFTLSLDKILDSEVDGVIITNLFGTYSELEKWADYCEEHRKILIYDNASSPLSSFQGINICNFGDYSFGSLHHTKYLGVGEGGFIVAPSKDYDQLQAICNFGFDASRDYHPLSSNFKMSDISAAYIISHLNNYSAKKHLEAQEKLITGIENKKLFRYKDGVVYGSFPIISEEGYDLQSPLVEIKKYYRPLSQLPQSVDLYKKVYNFPLYASLSDDQLETIIGYIRGLR